MSDTGDREPPAGEPPVPPMEAAAEPSDPRARAFTVQGRTWIARLAGIGLGGTGHLASARLGILHFYAEGESAPRFEALVPAGRFPDLFESELAELLWSARPLPPPERPA